MKFRTLKEDEIECRVGQISAKGFKLLLYKNARVDMDLLDETVGAGNWQRDHKELKGNIYCGVSIWDETKKQWITKWDCGTESNTEKEKGEASDSFKRACVNVGIGRELYTSPFVWIAGNVSKIDRNGREAYVPTIRSMKVQEIGYTDDRKINRLVIIGDGEVIFEFGKETPKKAAKTDETPKTDKWSEEERKVFEMGEFTEQNIGYIKTVELKYDNRYNGKTVGDLTYEEIIDLIGTTKSQWLKDRLCTYRDFLAQTRIVGGEEETPF